MRTMFDRDLDRALEPLLGGEPHGGAQGWAPPADVYETEDHVVIEIDVPGVRPDALGAELVDGQLVVTGERATSEGRRFYRQERWGGRFARSFALGRQLRGVTDVEAAYADGVLRLQLRKPAEAAPRRIEIRVDRGAQQREIVDADSRQTA